MHLNEGLAPARLDPVLPGIGRGWASLVGSLSVLYFQLGVHAGQFESLAALWEEEWFDPLQPDSPGLHLILTFLCTEQIRDVGTNEVQLLGASSRSCGVAGGYDFVKSGAVAAGGGEETEP
jgi:hypothetical protein